VNDGFILFDTLTGKPWEHYLRVYGSRSGAANSYNNAVRYSRDLKPWKVQKSIVAKPIRIIDAETGETFT
jgi:hypothetical protein